MPPTCFPAILQPQIGDQPVGTSITLEFEGATSTKGTAPTGFSTNVDIADDQPYVAFRATLVGNTTTLLLPNFDTVAIPYLRPQGG